ncbi:hypothetical protein Agub_g5675 [Astrephomene gubernaculifera]|uniref:RWP-RK domain-containing protein n=1 Tax=Astrephomene gubernaculifera TaxID=47775 RepID=A0AAD3HKZ3_9CHLO|nr:hypothetical protein Agub_g5675 [Astrephomene gubernaculifera]
MRTSPASGSNIAPTRSVQADTVHAFDFVDEGLPFLRDLAPIDGNWHSYQAPCNDYRARTPSALAPLTSGGLHHNPSPFARPEVFNERFGQFASSQPPTSFLERSNALVYSLAAATTIPALAAAPFSSNYGLTRPDSISGNAGSSSTVAIGSTARPLDNRAQFVAFGIARSQLRPIMAAPSTVTHLLRAERAGSGVASNPPEPSQSPWPWSSNVPPHRYPQLQQLPSTMSSGPVQQRCQQQMQRRTLGAAGVHMDQLDDLLHEQLFAEISAAPWPSFPTPNSTASHACHDSDGASSSKNPSSADSAIPDKGNIPDNIASPALFSPYSSSRSSAGRTSHPIAAINGSGILTRAVSNAPDLPATAAVAPSTTPMQLQPPLLLPYFPSTQDDSLESLSPFVSPDVDEGEAAAAAAAACNIPHGASGLSCVMSGGSGTSGSCGRAALGGNASLTVPGSSPAGAAGTAAAPYTVWPQLWCPAPPPYAPTSLPSPPLSPPPPQLLPPPFSRMSAPADFVYSGASAAAAAPAAAASEPAPAALAATAVAVRPDPGCRTLLQGAEDWLAAVADEGAPDSSSFMAEATQDGKVALAEEEEQLQEASEGDEEEEDAAMEVVGVLEQVEKAGAAAAAAAGGIRNADVNGGGGAGGKLRRGTALFEALRKAFDLPASEAARSLGVSATELKRRCRTAGIDRWPQRKLSSLRRIEAAARTEVGLAEEERQFILESVARNRKDIFLDPNAPLLPYLKSLRQAQYKQSHDRRVGGGSAHGGARHRN